LEVLPGDEPADAEPPAVPLDEPPDPAGLRRGEDRPAVEVDEGRHTAHILPTAPAAAGRPREVRYTRTLRAPRALVRLPTAPARGAALRFLMTRGTVPVPREVRWQTAVSAFRGVSMPDVPGQLRPGGRRTA